MNFNCVDHYDNVQSIPRETNVWLYFLSYIIFIYLELKIALLFICLVFHVHIIVYIKIYNRIIKLFWYYFPRGWTSPEIHQFHFCPLPLCLLHWFFFRPDARLSSRHFPLPHSYVRAPASWISKPPPFSWLIPSVGWSRFCTINSFLKQSKWGVLRSCISKYVSILYLYLTDHSGGYLRLKINLFQNFEDNVLY